MAGTKTASVSRKPFHLALFLRLFVDLLLTYAAVGFLNEAIKSTFSLILFTGSLTLAGSVFGYYLVRRAAQSFHDGFLNKPLNIILCLTLPILLSHSFLRVVQFPSMFIWEYITVPSNWFGCFICKCVGRRDLGDRRFGAI